MHSCYSKEIWMREGDVEDFCRISELTEAERQENLARRSDFWLFLTLSDCFLNTMTVFFHCL